MPASRAHLGIVRIGAALLAAGALASSGCALWRPTPVPLRTIAEPAACPTPPDTLLVMLPGAYSMPEEFVREGFVRAARERGLAADIVLVDAHLGYYAERSIVVRLHEDVVSPARARYAHVWLVGISVGAFGSILYARDHPGDVDGIVAIGPYLGERATSAAIGAQGGLARWRAPGGPLDAPDDVDASLWRWLQPYSGVPPGVDRPPMFLGYGRDDRFAAGDALLAAALPAARVFTAAGGHDWGPWRVLWQRILDAAPLPRDPRCAGAAAFAAAPARGPTPVAVPATVPTPPAAAR